jgi:hypothetical protein
MKIIVAEALQDNQWQYNTLSFGSSYITSPFCLMPRVLADGALQLMGNIQQRMHTLPFHGHIQADYAENLWKSPAPAPLRRNSLPGSL